MNKLLSLTGRDIFLLSAASKTQPAVFLVCDQQAGGGIMVNCPPFNATLADNIAAICPLRYIFLPSYFGACDLDLWRTHTGAQSIASEVEGLRIDGTIDINVDRHDKLTRTIGFLPMSGRTRGSCALYLRNLPGVIFFGPILSHCDNGWPGLSVHADDDSYENRIIGALGLQDLTFAHAFCDDYCEPTSQHGPDAATHVNAAIQRAINDAQ